MHGLPASLCSTVFSAPDARDGAVGTVLPYGVAFKIVHATGLVALPAATYFIVRWIGFERIVAGLAAVTGGMFVFMESLQVLGGNVKSAIIGEFSFSGSLALLAVYVGLIVRDAEVRRRIEPWPGVVLAMVAASHIVSVVVGVAVSGLLLLQRSRRRVVLVSWNLGFGLVGFWAVPFIVLILQGMSPDSNWQPLTGLTGADSPLPIDLVPILPFAAVGLIWSLRRRDRIAPIVGLAVIPLAAYFLLPLLGLSSGFNGRFLPFWYYGVFVIGGIGIGRCVVAAGRTIQVKADGVAAPSGESLLLSQLERRGRRWSLPCCALVDGCRADGRVGGAALRPNLVRDRRSRPYGARDRSCRSLGVPTAKGTQGGR